MLVFKSTYTMRYINSKAIQHQYAIRHKSL